MSKQYTSLRSSVMVVQHPRHDDCGEMTTKLDKMPINDDDGIDDDDGDDVLMLETK